MSGTDQFPSMKYDPDVFVGGGEMGMRMRAHDWSNTPLGSPESWPQPLKTLVGVMLAAGQPMFVAWGSQRILLYNDAYAALMGERHPHGLGQSFFVVWPDVVDECVPLFDRVFAGEPVHMEDIELRMERRGRPREAHFAFSYTPVRDEAGTVAGLFCVCNEITERVFSRRREAQEADRQRALFQQMPGFVAVLSGPDHVFDYVNDAYVALAGPRVFIGRGARDVFPELAGQGFHELLDQVYATGVTFKANAEPVRLAGDVDDRFIDYMYQPMRDAAGEVTGIFVVGHDVTDRVRAEAATREAGTRLHELNATLEAQVREQTAERNLLASIMESTDTLVMAASLDYTILAINSANADEFERIYGVRPRVGDNMLELLADQPEHQAQVRAGWGLGLAGRPVNIVDEFGDRERARPHYEIKFRPLHDDHGTLIGCYQFVVDVTQRLRDQISLTETQEALRQSQKMETIGQLTGGVAHDFNNLLTVIRASCHLLRRPDLSEDKRRRYVSAISETVDRAAKLTGQLLAFARRQALKPEVFAVCDSVRALTEMMGTLIGSRVQIAIDLPDQPCFVNADPSQFDTALVNLTVNARDAMDSVGRIGIRVRGVDGIPAIRTHERQTGSFVAVSITDTGSGIPPDLVERVFEPFFTTKVLGKGTGLGLSQVFGFAKQSGGEVTVDSTVGEGTTFTLYLPRVAPPEPSVVVQAPEMLVDGHGIRVLVVEDNEDVGAFAVQSLTDLGYTTILAADGLAALAELARGGDRFDVVFSDVMMPGMTGIELGQEIRRLYHDLPVVLTSGYSHVLAQNGTYGFELLHKPYSVEELSRMLNKAATWQRRKRLLSQ